MRLNTIKTLKNSDVNVYPHKFQPSISFNEFIKKYSYLKNNELNEDIVSIAGRVLSKRLMSKNLAFFDLKSETHKIQVMVTLK